MHIKIKEFINSVKDRIAVSNGGQLNNYFSGQILNKNSKEVKKLTDGVAGFVVYTKINDEIILDEQIPANVEKMLHNEISDFGWMKDDDEYIHLMMIGIMLYYSGYEGKELKKELEEFSNYV